MKSSIVRSQRNESRLPGSSRIFGGVPGVSGGGSVPIHRSWNFPGPVARPEPLFTKLKGVSH